jgi:hypothetical protein
MSRLYSETFLDLLTARLALISEASGDTFSPLGVERYLRDTPKKGTPPFIEVGIGGEDFKHSDLHGGVRSEVTIVIDVTVYRDAGSQRTTDELITDAWGDVVRAILDTLTADAARVELQDAAWSMVPFRLIDVKEPSDGFRVELNINYGATFEELDIVNPY